MHGPFSKILGGSGPPAPRINDPAPRPYTVVRNDTCIIALALIVSRVSDINIIIICRNVTRRAHNTMSLHPTSDKSTGDVILGGNTITTQVAFILHVIPT